MKNLFFPIIRNVYLFKTGPYDKDDVDPYPPRPYPPRPYPPQTYPPRQQHPHGHPQQYKVAIGAGTRINCEFENHDKSTSWRRQDGQPLPRSSHLSGGDLVIEYTQEDAAGIYECIVHEPDGDYPIVTTELVVIGMIDVDFLFSFFFLIVSNKNKLFVFFLKNYQRSICIRQCQ